MAQPSLPGPFCDWHGGPVDVWCFAAASYVVLASTGELLAFSCDAHIAATLATFGVAVRAMLYDDWCSSARMRKSPATGADVPPARRGQHAGE